MKDKRNAMAWRLPFLLFWSSLAIGCGPGAKKENCVSLPEVLKCERVAALVNEGYDNHLMLVEATVYWSQGKAHPLFGEPALPLGEAWQAKFMEFGVFQSWVMLRGERAFRGEDTAGNLSHRVRLGMFKSFISENAEFLLGLEDIEDPLASLAPLLGGGRWPPEDPSQVALIVPETIRAFSHSPASEYSYEHYRRDVEAFLQFLRLARDGEEFIPAAETQITIDATAGS